MNNNILFKKIKTCLFSFKLDFPYFPYLIKLVSLFKKIKKIDIVQVFVKINLKNI